MDLTTNKHWTWKTIKKFTLVIILLTIIIAFQEDNHKILIMSFRFKLTEIDQKARELPEITDVFISGEEGYHTYRIPSVITTQKGTVLAFCEGRASRADHAHNDIVMKRSKDGGATWSDLKIIAEEGDDCLNNPTVVQIKETGRVLLMYQVYPDGFDERKAVPGYKKKKKVCRTYIIYSDDEGLLWSAPKDVTRSVKRKEIVTSTATGPGTGIQLERGIHKGRIIFPFNQGPYNRWKVYAVYSDNLGKSWNIGGTAPEGSRGLGNEVQMVELENGDILLNSRSAAGEKLRKKSVSKDGGVSWSPLLDEPGLPEPQCQGSILRFNFPESDQPGRIMFANPASQNKRVSGTIRLSYDEGETWPISRLIYNGSFAYSCLTKINDQTVGLLFEKIIMRK